jgi:hypothetical protein
VLQSDEQLLQRSRMKARPYPDPPSSDYYSTTSRLQNLWVSAATGSQSTRDKKGIYLVRDVLVDKLGFVMAQTVE